MTLYVNAFYNIYYIIYKINAHAREITFANLKFKLNRIIKQLVK